MDHRTPIGRRGFLRAGLAGGAALCALPAIAPVGTTRDVALIIDPEDPVASASPARWARDQLQQALSAAGVDVREHGRLQQATPGALCIVAAAASSPLLREPLTRAGLSVPETPESLALLSTRIADRAVTIACGSDARGMAFALTELADRVRHGAAVDDALRVGTPIVERPANAVRSVMRQFTSEPLDKPWYYDRDMWPRYLDMLAAHRFNRFHLAFGLGYDFLDHVADAYLLFAYPFLLAVPGYHVRATNLSDDERERNLDTLRFIGDEAVARGLEFQLGLWMHGYQWPDKPPVRHVIQGLTPETHGAYCRDALTAVLEACPAISSVVLRTHGESGVPEGSYAFWRTIFDGVPRSRRRVEIDLHAKGLDMAMIEAALATGMPVNVGLKCWAEHQGLPYHQAAIRETEMPVAGRSGAGLMALSEGARSFTRYGYADLLREDRKYTATFRVFSGTQRILLWGDPAAAAAYSRAFQFCGSRGTDLMEPLTCRGRRGTGVPGSRIGYADDQWEPRWDWEKYAYWYRVWGRMLYDPATSAEVCHRHFGTAPAARSLESGLARASRVLPVVSMSHMPSAACDAYWPEIYWNQPMVQAPAPNPYPDSPSPPTFQNVSPLDPQLFSRMTDCADELIRHEPSGKYSPIEVAQWLEELTLAGEEDLKRAGTLTSLDLRRAAIDVRIQIGLGRFFAAKFRSGVLYAIHERTGDGHALEQAVRTYKVARSAWGDVASHAQGVYTDDLSASDKISNRGAWGDRLTGIDADVAQMEARLATAGQSDDPRVAAAIAEALGRPRRDPIACEHRPPARFRPGDALPLDIGPRAGATFVSVSLFYRHVSQAERWQEIPMTRAAAAWRASIPARYTDSPYLLQYYFRIAYGPQRVWLYPGLAEDLLGQPYFVVRREGVDVVR